ncbi:hypothetical protein ACH55_02835 [Salmonella enterica subsp. enterica serovar Typhimurium]|nr:hypothetical protein ACH55_02835 [Salmonella enterica subsp. enterica serovar Typhimurium]KTO07073.1 hypothetical protein IN63_20540 [Salmonella enterica]
MGLVQLNIGRWLLLFVHYRSIKTFENFPHIMNLSLIVEALVFFLMKNYKLIIGKVILHM